MPSCPLLELRDIAHRYGATEVLRGVSLTVEPGELVALVGKSGSGKSTLLQLAGLLDQPTAGVVLLDGRDAFAVSEPELARMRAEYVGFVFQAHHLLPEFDALENVLLPVLVTGRVTAELESRARELLDSVGLGHRLHHRPHQLSGGEQQRVAIARALIRQPRLLLADEPTGNLDEATGEEVFRLLLDLNARLGTAALVVTHSERLARRLPRRVLLSEGRIVDPSAEADSASNPG